MTICTTSTSSEALCTGARWIAAFTGGASRRAFWMLLAIIHLVPLVGMLRGWVNDGSVSSVISFVLLSAAVAFFALKAVDVRCLRFGRSGMLAFVLACTLVHAEAAPASAAKIMLAETPAAMAIAVALEGLTRAKRFVPQALRYLHRMLAHGLQIVQIRIAACDRASADLRSFTSLRLAIPRGPPLRARLI